MSDSIRLLFHKAGYLVETGVRRSSSDSRSFLVSISSAIGSGTLQLEADEHILSGTADGDALAQHLGIPCGDGDAWSIGREINNCGDYYILVIYSAAKNQNLPISRISSNWEFYGPGNSKVARRGGFPQVPVTKYSFRASTGEEDNTYANSGYVYGNGTKARVVKGPEGRNTVF